MKTSLEKLERNVKTDRAFVLILTVLTALLAVSMFIEGFSLMSKDAADFSIQTEAGDVQCESVESQDGQDERHPLRDDECHLSCAGMSARGFV